MLRDGLVPASFRGALRALYVHLYARSNFVHLYTCSNFAQPCGTARAPRGGVGYGAAGGALRGSCSGGFCCCCVSVFCCSQ